MRRSVDAEFSNDKHNNLESCEQWSIEDGSLSSEILSTDATIFQEIELFPLTLNSKCTLPSFTCSLILREGEKMLSEIVKKCKDNDFQDVIKDKASHVVVVACM